LGDPRALGEVAADYNKVRPSLEQKGFDRFYYDWIVAPEMDVRQMGYARQRALLDWVRG
jgi:hypothetical protein